MSDDVGEGLREPREHGLNVDAGAIRSLMEGILRRMDGERNAAHEGLADHPAAVQARRHVSAGDYGAFRLSVSHPFDEFADTLLDGVCASPEARFIFKRSDFVERHFCRVIGRVEGSACSMDKTRSIVRALLAFYAHGRRIEFDGSVAPSYGQPLRVFRDHDQIVSFLEGLFHLYYGAPEKYLAALRGLALEAPEGAAP